MPPPFPDLSSFVRHLESRGELKRVKVEVDPFLEMTEIAVRVVKAGGPALLFENPRGSSFPVLMNALASPRRIEWALGRPAAEVGEEIASFIEDARSFSLSTLWRRRGTVRRGLSLRPRRVGRGPALDVSGAPDLDALPLLTSWPGDGGRFVTFPLVFSKSPVNGVRNVGMYRLQAFDKATTGMHWQLHRGGGFHFFEAERLGIPLPVAVVIGADPVSMLSATLPLPEDMDELSFAGFLRGSPVPCVRLSNGLEVPANAEFILEGEVLPGERRQEGPFGDHFGHYSKAAPYPVFHVRRVHHRTKAIYPAAVVGKPPQEDTSIGNAVQEMMGPLIRLLHPEITDLWAYHETGFHNLAVASVRQRYQKEALRSALWLLGEGQMALTKCVILVDPGVNVRSFSAVLDALRDHFDPREDFILLPGTIQDTLDFTGPSMNLGSKMILDATSGGKPPRPSTGAGKPIKLMGPGGTHLPCRNWNDTLLAVQVRPERRWNGRDTVEWLIKEKSLQNFRLIVAVSPDVPLDDDVLLLWGLFTRFDCAQDVVPHKTFISGVHVSFEGPLGIDATWKPEYPEPLAMDPEIIERVDRRWKDYGIQI